MPTISSCHLPKPKSWDEFEDITLSALKLRWNNPDLTRHGRQGQKQTGVDIYGQNSLRQQIGVQCKNTVSQITSDIIDSEIVNAEQFSPTLSDLYIATSADSCVHLQKYVRSLSVSRVQAKKFGIQILFWNDISQDLSTSPELIAKHYPHFSIFSTQPVILSDRDKDICQMNELLSYVDLERIQYDTFDAPKIVNSHFMEVIDVLLKIRQNPVFVLFDQKLQTSLDSFLAKWQEISCTGAHCYDYHGANHIIFYMPGDCFRSSEDQRAFETLTTLYSELRSVLTNFVLFVSQSYPEINIQQTNTIARRRYAEMEKGLQEWAIRNKLS